MAHGHRRDPSDFELDLIDSEGEATEELDVVEAMIRETLGAVTDRPADAYYHRYPRYGTEEDALDALLRNRWDPNDSRILRILQPGDPDGQPIRYGGGGSSGRKTKQPVKRITSSRPSGRASIVEGRIYEGVTTELRVRLTPGERGYYLNRTGEAREVLIKAGSLILVDPALGTHHFHYPVPYKSNFDIYGLPLEIATALTIFDGTARRALARHAHQQDHDHIIQIDFDFLKKWAYKEVLREWSRAGRVADEDSRAFDADVHVRQRRLESVALDKE